MAFLGFEELPLYFGTGANTTTLPGQENDNDQKVVAATNVQFSYTPNIANVGIVGRTGDRRQILSAGPSTVTLSFGGILETGDNGEFFPFAFTGDQDAGTTAIIGNVDGGLKLSGLYMTALSFNVTPYAPIAYTCDFIAFSTDITGYQALTATTDTDLKSRASATGTFHGAYTTFANMPAGNSLNFESISYSYAANYTPIYSFSGKEETQVILNSAEQNIQVQADDHVKNVLHTGALATPTLTLKTPVDAAGTGIVSKGVITATNVSVSAGDIAKATINIQEPLF